MSYAQNSRPVVIKGQVLDELDKSPLSYASIGFFDLNDQLQSGGITNDTGYFEVEIVPGTYFLQIDYISYDAKRIDLNALSSMDLGSVFLTQNQERLDEVVVRAESTEVQIRLDKKIYTIGKDLTTSGATVSDALNNVPSVTVDVDGSIALRGNDNVRILINGKPSAIAGFGQTDALRQLPAEAIERVEVITAPSARYDAEGTAGILNIILRKEKTRGLNGSFQANANEPLGYGTTLNLNWRTNKFNLFTTTGYRHRESPGNASYNNRYFNPDFEAARYTERRKFDRMQKGVNTSLGIEYFLTESSSITASVFLRRSDDNDQTENQAKEWSTQDLLLSHIERLQDQDEKDQSLQYALNYVNDLNTNGHKLTADLQFEQESEDQFSSILERLISPEPQGLPEEDITQNESVTRLLAQADYVLPYGRDRQFELGFRYDARDQTTDYLLREQTTVNGPFEVNLDLSNRFDFTQNIFAVYTQYGAKFGKFSALAGLRLEHTGLKGAAAGVNNQGNTQALNLDFDKDFLGLFPTLNLVYELNENSNISLGYNRRINRPRSWFINPFPSRSSETNIFQGNPDLNPAYASALDLGYMIKNRQFTLTTSIYGQYETQSFERIQEETGEVTDNGIPVIRTIPINLSTNQRIGFELGILYNPAKWLRFNSSFNFFQFETQGIYNDIDFGAKNVSWFTRSGVKINLPGDVNTQTNLFYRGPNQNAQTKSEGIASIDLAVSKDLFDEKMSLSFNVNDLLNSRKRRSLTVTDDFESDSVFQWRVRTWTVGVLYRFNQKKSQRGRDNNRGGGYNDEGFEG
jgi:outer membrane receptor for ferrienterochelin and colicin